MYVRSDFRAKEFSLYLASLIELSHVPAVALA